MHALPALLTKQSRYFRELLAGEFSEGADESAPATETETNDAEEDKNSEGEKDKGSAYVEDWLDYFSDSDASYCDDGDDEVAQSEREKVNACLSRRGVMHENLTLHTEYNTSVETRKQHGEGCGE